MHPLQLKKRRIADYWHHGTHMLAGIEKRLISAIILLWGERGPVRGEAGERK